MRGLYNVIESILSSDEKVTQELTGKEATVRFHYQLFVDYVGDLLYKKAPYQNLLSSGEINFLIKDQDTYIDKIYTQFDIALNKYFRELQRIHKDKKISWTKNSELGAISYRLSIIDKKSKEKQIVTFKICNRKDNRLIRVITDKNKPFMTP